MLDIEYSSSLARHVQIKTFTSVKPCYGALPVSSLDIMRISHSVR